MNEIKTTIQTYIDTSGINAYTRKRDIVYSRYIVFNFLRKMNLTLTEIGKMFDFSSRNDCLDHATVHHGIRNYNALCVSSYSDFEAIRTRLENELEALVNHKGIGFDAIQEPIALMNISIELSKLYACNEK